MRQEIESLKVANKDLRTTAAEEESNNDTKKKLKVKFASAKGIYLPT